MRESDDVADTMTAILPQQHRAKRGGAFQRRSRSRCCVALARNGSEEAAARACLKLVDPSILSACFVPRAEFLRKRDGVWRLELHPLFGGYLFLYSDDPAALGKRLRSLRASVRPIVGDDDACAFLTDGEQQWFEELLDEDFVLRFSRGRIVDGRTTVVEGPLRGCESRIRKIDRHRRIAFVETSLARRETTMHAGLEVTSKT